MSEAQFDIIGFVRGMAWHDIGKPFALATPRHSALGYWLLSLAGYPDEALVALAHGHNLNKVKDLRKEAEHINNPDPKKAQDAEEARTKLKAEALLRYLTDTKDRAIPAILLLCNAIDRMSASIYSLQSRGSVTTHHSLQNPFSRLPQKPIEDGGPFAVTDLNEFENRLWGSLQTNTPRAWKEGWLETFSKQAKDNIEDKDQAISQPTSLATGEDERQIIVNHILKYMKKYPERTYPSVNDTSLVLHCRLSGILAFVAYKNIEQKNEAWLKADVTIEENGELKGMPFPNADVALADHLEADLVRVSFEGYRWLYEKAARVDDLHGARELTDKIQNAFKKTLAEELDVPELAELLTLSESQFDLTYLLPPPGNGQTLEAIIHLAFQKAIRRVVDSTISRLRQSFGSLIDDLTPDLVQQLTELGYGVRLIQVPIPQRIKFDKLTAQYGHNLLEAYKESQGHVTFPQTNLATHGEEIPPDETCEVCGNYPILVPPTNLKTSDAMTEWQRHLNYAGHIFRGENERICLSCVARRTLAYGKIAKRMDHLVHPMLKQVRPGLWRVISSPEDSISPPPALISTVQLDSTRDDELVSMGAFYVRHRRTQGSVDTSELDIFPTTSYAADVNSNVILLSLRPTEELFSTYSYIEAIKNATQDEPLTHPDFELWQQTFIEFYNKAKVEIEAQEEAYQQGKRKNPPPDILEPIGNVHPHLARVMERIHHLKQFYEILWETLTKEKIHTLPLDLDFPTLRLLLPADRLVQALQVLDRVMTKTLFSATYPVEDSQIFHQERQELHNLLSQLVPSLLHGTAILFKQKYALYLALEAERDLFRQLVDGDQEIGPGRRQYDGDGHAEPWYGLRLALSDLRGTLSGAAPMLAQLTYGDLGDVLRLAQTIDRRTVTGRAAIIDSSAIDQHASADEITQLADALTLIRGKRIGKSDQVKELLDAHEKKFKPVHFIKTATRT